MKTTLAVIGIATAFIVITGIIVLGAGATAGWIAGDNAFSDPYAAPATDQPKEIWVDAKGRKFRCAEFVATVNQFEGTYHGLGYAPVDRLHKALKDASVRVEMLGLIPWGRTAYGTRQPDFHPDTSSLSMAEMETALRHCMVGRG